jgi:alpha-methylacyl-CoA racemase
MPPPSLTAATVLDLSTVGPAARCARILADYGARVVKVGAPPSRGAVQIQPAYWAYSAGRGMQQARIDLKAEAGREAFLRLAEGADVVIESFRPGVVDRLGIGYEAVRERRPGIVYCSTSGYGQTGPASRWAGHDVNYLALGGYLHSSGRRADGGPALPGATIADSAAGGMQAAIAILAALVRRASTGEGAYLDVSVAEGVLSLMSLAIDEHLATGAVPGPGHDVLTGRYACYGIYGARDGKWLSVAAIEPHFFANLCKALGLERWADRQHDDGAQEAMRRDFAAAFATRDRDEWTALLAPADTCVAPVYDASEIARDPHFAARGVWAEAEHPEAGRFRQLGPVLAGAARGEAPTRVRGAEETDTEALLAEAGLAADAIAEMRRSGVIA